MFCKFCTTIFEILNLQHYFRKLTYFFTTLSTPIPKLTYFFTTALTTPTPGLTFERYIFTNTTPSPDLKCFYCIEIQGFFCDFLVNFVSIYDSNYENIVEFFSSSQSALIFSIFIIITFFHSALSISEIFEDYIGSEKTRKFANMMVYLSSFIIPTITLLTLYKL